MQILPIQPVVDQLSFPAGYFPFARHSGVAVVGTVNNFVNDRLPSDGFIERAPQPAIAATRANMNRIRTTAMGEIDRLAFPR
jgi:hypothetical protein